MKCIPLLKIATPPKRTAYYPAYNLLYPQGNIHPSKKKFLPLNDHPQIRWIPLPQSDYTLHNYDTNIAP